MVDAPNFQHCNVGQAASLLYGADQDHTRKCDEGRI